MARKHREALKLPVISRSAEHLVRGFLMRRNILTYEAPPNNPGYDLVSVHPDPCLATKCIRVQVKSRYASNAERWVPLAAKTLEAFDFLVVVFLNIGNSGAKENGGDSRDVITTPEFYTFPAAYVKEHHRQSVSPDPRAKGARFEWLPLNEDGIKEYGGMEGFEQIARALRVDDPCKAQATSTVPVRRRKRKSRATDHWDITSEMEDDELQKLWG
jgi:hypothetical protein